MLYYLSQLAYPGMEQSSTTSERQMLGHPSPAHYIQIMYVEPKSIVREQNLSSNVSIQSSKRKVFAYFNGFVNHIRDLCLHVGSFCGYPSPPRVACMMLKVEGDGGKSLSKAALHVCSEHSKKMQKT